MWPKLAVPAHQRCHQGSTCQSTFQADPQLGNHELQIVEFLTPFHVAFEYTCESNPISNEGSSVD
jgi:hypothetical protein